MKLPKITNASVTLNLTLDDGKTKEYRFDLDDQEEGRPITCQLDLEVDIVDATDYLGDRHLRHEPGERCTVSLHIDGRGPVAEQTGDPK